MRAINHALTGALIGLTVSEPAIALPAALLSHYVMDFIPHHDMVGGSRAAIAVQQKWHRSRLFKKFLVADATLCFLVVLALVLVRPTHWLSACFCAFLAAAPDLESANYYFHLIRHKPWKPGVYYHFARTIQWFERPIGAAVEVAWAIAMLILITPFFR